MACRTHHTSLGDTWQGLITWLAFVEESAQAHATMALCVHRFTHREASKAWQQWAGLTLARRECLQKLHTASYRLANQHVTRAFGSWHAVSSELIRKKSLLRSALARIRNRLLALVYDAWARWLAREHEVGAILTGCAHRIANRLALMVFDSWRDFLDTRKRTRAIAARITGNHELGLLANGLAQWRRRADAAAELTLKMRRAMGFLTHAIEAMAWSGWRALVIQAHDRRAKLLPIGQRLLHRLIALTFHGWTDFVAMTKDERVKATRAIGMWSGACISPELPRAPQISPDLPTFWPTFGLFGFLCPRTGKLVLRCFLSWLHFTTRKQRHRHENSEALFRRDKTLATSHLRAWHGAWVHRTTERALMTRSLSFFTNGNTMKCLNTWRSHAQAASSFKRNLRSGFGRWRNAQLNEGFRRLLEHLHVERDAIDKARRVLSRLTNKHLNAGWLTWQDFATTRAMKLDAMRAVGEAVVNRGKRACFNTLLTVLDEANQLRTARMRIQNREAVFVMTHWGALGRNHRVMISALRRLSQQDLTRGYMGWMLGWREALAIQERAMGKARQFVGRLRNLEVARGWSALVATWQRVLQLRVMLKKVANPRAVGMLRRWARLAHVQSEQIRKLRSTMALIHNGCITRVVKAWRDLCRKRRLVKARVGALLGRMLEATFRGWVRHAHKRIACRAAGEEVLALRTERVCADWIRRWTYAAHLSGALATGLRSLFMRSTFSVFRAWATWAAETRADRHALEALQKVTLGNARAGVWLDRAGRRWRRFEEAAAFQIWAVLAEIKQTAQVFTHLAISHSTQACVCWAFREYAFAVKVQIEERAAALFHDHGRLSFCMRVWSTLAKRAAIANSRSARAIFFFCGRLVHLIFFRWREAAHAVRDNRLATLAAKLHFDGTLAWRMFLGWKEHVQYVLWRFRQTQAGLARHFLSIERSVWMAWKESHAIMRGLHEQCDSRFLDKTYQEKQFAFKQWASTVSEVLRVTRIGLGLNDKALKRRGMIAWLEFSTLSGILASQAGFSNEHSSDSRRRRAFLRWHALSRMASAFSGIAEMLGGKRSRGGLRRGFGIWVAFWEVRESAQGMMERALGAFGEDSVRKYLHIWALKSRLTAGALQAIKLAIASQINRLSSLGFERWRERAEERADFLRSLRRTFAHYTNHLVCKCYAGWAKLVGRKARRDEVCRKFIGRVMNRTLAMAWLGFRHYLEQRRALKVLMPSPSPPPLTTWRPLLTPPSSRGTTWQVDVINMAFRSSKGQLALRFRDWTVVSREGAKFGHLLDTAVGHRLGVLSGSAAYNFREWAKQTKLFNICAMLTGKHGRRRLRAAFSAMRTYRHYRKFSLAAQRTEQLVLESALGVWMTSMRLTRALEFMGGENLARDSRRRLRMWHHRATRATSCELRRRYISSRRIFYQRQTIIQGWRIQATAGQHAKRMSQLAALRQLARLTREVHFQQRATVRAIALWSTSLVQRVCKAWELHTRMARESRHELLRARANQTALEAHRRRARARALSTIVTSWRRYTRGKRETRTLANAAAAAYGRTVGFERWRIWATFHNRTVVASGLAAAHRAATARRVSFGLWALKSSKAVHRAGVLLVLLQRRAYATRLTVLFAWRGLTDRSRGLYDIALRVNTRFVRSLLLAWRAAVVRILVLEQSIDSMEERALWRRLLQDFRWWHDRTEHNTERRTLLMERVATRLRGALATALDFWQRWARRTICEAVLTERREASERRMALHMLRANLLHDRKMMGRAMAHATSHLGYKTLLRWNAFVDGRHARRVELAAGVELLINARILGVTGEVVRLWKAVAHDSRRERLRLAAALGQLKALRVVAGAERARCDSALEYYRRRLAGVVFFHWRALSWSMNWEKPGHLAEEGVDLSSGAAGFSERAANHKHARLAAHFVRGSVVHQRRSTLTFQEQSFHEKKKEAAAASSAPTSPRKGATPSRASRGSSPSRRLSSSASASPRRAHHTSPMKAPAPNGLSPTGLSVALVLGSQLLDDAADDDLELDDAFSSARLTRQKTFLARQEEAADEMAADEDDDGPADDDDDDDDPLPRRLADSPYRAGRGRTPATAATAMSTPRALATSRYPTLEEFAAMEAAKGSQRRG